MFQQQELREPYDILLQQEDHDITTIRGFCVAISLVLGLQAGGLLHEINAYFNWCWLGRSVAGGGVAVRCNPLLQLHMGLLIQTQAVHSSASWRYKLGLGSETQLEPCLNIMQ